MWYTGIKIAFLSICENYNNLSRLRLRIMLNLFSLFVCQFLLCGVLICLFDRISVWFEYCVRYISTYSTYTMVINANIHFLSFFDVYKNDCIWSREKEKKKKHLSIYNHMAFTPKTIPPNKNGKNEHFSYIHIVRIFSFEHLHNFFIHLLLCSPT